jgi:hypothetical protein
MGGIITVAKLKRLRRELEALRAAKHNIRPADLVSLAKKLGRRLDNRGKHPMYVSDLLQNSKPISIPGHPTIKSYTAVSILDDLEVDLVKLVEMIETEAKEHEKRKALPPATIRPNRDSR